MVIIYYLYYRCAGSMLADDKKLIVFYRGKFMIACQNSTNLLTPIEILESDEERIAISNTLLLII